MLPTLQQSSEDFPRELKFIKFRCLTEIGKSEKSIHLKEQHTHLGIIKLSESEPSHLFRFSYICYPIHMFDRRDTHAIRPPLHLNWNTEGSYTQTHIHTPPPLPTPTAHKQRQFFSLLPFVWMKRNEGRILLSGKSGIFPLEVKTNFVCNIETMMLQKQEVRDAPKGGLHR